ncbi:MAG: thioredoxin [Deltaproteobacteria bacterium]|jgi:thioredoxin 1|nr:thioredoxin [Deltaproteobacteria bacterium]MBW2531701.1 thioredoxin [Deltaproteobacteria bacterium]
MADSKNVHAFDDKNFDQEVLQASGPVMVDFTATWCGTCKMLSPIIEKLADDFSGKLKVGKVDVDAAPGVAAKYGIRSVPTVIVFEGGKKKAQHTGLTKREKLLEMAGLG